MRKLRHFILIIYKHDLNWLFELSGMPGQGFIAGNWDKFGLGSKGLTVFSSSHGFDTTKFVAQTGYDFSFFSSRFEKFGSRIGTHKNLPGKLLRIWMLSNLDHGLKDSPCSPREPLKSKKNRVYFLQIFYLISVWTCIFFICARFSTWACSCLHCWIQRSFWFLFGPRCRMVVKVAVGLSPWNCFMCRWRWWFWMNFAPQTSHVYFRSWPCAWTEPNINADPLKWAWNLLKWASTFMVLLNFSGQSGHWMVFSWLSLLWFLKSISVAKVFPHTSHGNLFASSGSCFNQGFGTRALNQYYWSVC